MARPQNLTDADVLSLRQFHQELRTEMAADTIWYGNNRLRRRLLCTANGFFLVTLDGQSAKLHNLSTSLQEMEVFKGLYPDDLPELFVSLEIAVHVYNLLASV